ncbi:hypothetical protein BEWA_024050 [Theileria equi strain WA]|uniref:Uncharacterized protein n=1 Tax=Theileria equi strain WA TaxID=1537102 RepID=L0AX05_THEEQ|nr:hypothetical protein BEWA_024050 [Theileria equi strain WA]AFZ79556.1 hypothetical protein BEWA_024050 [Theileria equi strain WA]|eukprot:XP_004829222.1 hypothetical protein BEWA_024050 [Theileria equi strain WA]
MVPSIDIRNKCPNIKDGKNTCQCKDVYQIKALRGTLKGTDGRDTDYRYCKHRNETNELLIKDLNYNGQPLKVEDGRGSKLLSATHSTIWEVTTYYSFEHDKNAHVIKVPLILGVRSKISEYNSDNVTWYENSSINGDNLTWKRIDDPGTENEYPKTDKEHATTEGFTKKLNELTCNLHKLHIVDIYRTSSYDCACSNAHVTVIPDKGTTLPGYTKYNYQYTSSENFVRYKRVNIKDGDDDKPLTLNHRTPKLSVYYWDADKKRRKKPLLMEVYVGGEKLLEGHDDTPVLVFNSGVKDNSKWTMDVGSVSADTLHKQKCKLFHPVIIDVTRTTRSYPNPYCIKEGYKNGECPNKDSPHEVEVEKCDGSIFELTSCTGWKHTYGKKGEPFTVTKFIGGLGTDLINFPIWNAREVIVFFASCDKPDDPATKIPLQIYVKSENGAIRKWQRSEDRDGGEWKVESILGNNPPDTTMSLKSNPGTAKEQEQQHNDDLSEEEEEGYIEKIEQSESSPSSSQQTLSPTELKEPEIEQGGAREGEIVLEEKKVPEKLETTAPVPGPIVDNKAISEAGEAPTTASGLTPEPAPPKAPPTSGTVATTTVHSGSNFVDEGSSRTDTGDTPGPKEAHSQNTLPTAQESEALNNLGAGGNSGGENTISRKSGTDESVLWKLFSATTRFLSEAEHLRSTMAGLAGLGITTAAYNLVHGIEGLGRTLAATGIIGRATAPTDTSTSLSLKIPKVDVEQSGYSQRATDVDGQDGDPDPKALGESTEAKAQPAAQTAALGQDDSGPSPGSLDSSVTGSTRNPTTTKIVVSVTTGILGTSALACFTGWKLYNRYKGDPWVRQI